MYRTSYLHDTVRGQILVANSSTCTSTGSSESSDSPFIPITSSTEPRSASDKTSQSPTEQSQPAKQQNTNSSTPQVLLNVFRVYRLRGEEMRCITRLIRDHVIDIIL